MDGRKPGNRYFNNVKYNLELYFNLEMFFLQGMNGVAVNQLNLSKNQPVVIQHMDTIEFGGSKFMYMFRLLSSESGDEPLAKKMRIPLADRNYPSLRDSPELYNNWMRSKKSLEKTLVEESDNLDVKLEQHKILKDSIITEQKKLTEQFENAKAQLEIKFANEKKEFEEKVARGMIEKSELQKEKEILEERMTKAFEEFQVRVLSAIFGHQIRYLFSLDGKCPESKGV